MTNIGPVTMNAMEKATTEDERQAIATMGALLSWEEAMGREVDPASDNVLEQTLAWWKDEMMATEAEYEWQEES